jgi:homospermidine synthase
MTLGERSNYAIREALLKEVRKNKLKTTAISCCGANPGMVSWLVKQALINLARDTGYPLEK